MIFCLSRIEIDIFAHRCHFEFDFMFYYFGYLMNLNSIKCQYFLYFQNPSQIPKTNFQCKGRPAGYYADVEAGEYHSDQDWIYYL